ncbi:hypothetical protein V8F20_005944 [Naviculisporaceae sp. PSN 640]
MQAVYDRQPSVCSLTLSTVQRQHCVQWWIRDLGDRPPNGMHSKNRPRRDWPCCTFPKEATRLRTGAPAISKQFLGRHATYHSRPLVGPEINCLFLTTTTTMGRHMQLCLVPNSSRSLSDHVNFLRFLTSYSLTSSYRQDSRPQSKLLPLYDHVQETPEPQPDLKTMGSMQARSLHCCASPQHALRCRYAWLVIDCLSVG